MHVCTIIARNYLPQARVLAASVRSVHDDARMTVLVVDDLGHEVDDSAEWFEVMRLDDLEGDIAELRRMAVIYNVLEYSTALKPWLLRTLLRDGPSPVIYLDPDIQVFDRLDVVTALARDHDLVLTPHATSPMPRDGKSISESDILAAGIYNLGFVAVGEKSQGVLDYWSLRLERECVVDPQGMRFVDQRWLDFTPGIFDVAILRDPGYNVAYWNLDHRRLSWTGTRFEVTSTPLIFFHFSGYSPRAPHLLSKHQMQPPRILLSEHSALRKICDEYGERLIANGFYEAAVGSRYGFDRMANGLPIDDAVRRLYRDALMRADLGDGPYPQDPFSPDGAQALVSWMNGVAEVQRGPARLSRYLASVYAGRSDLQEAFPDPQDRDFERFNAWARHEVADGRMDGRMLPPASDGTADGTGGRSFKFANPDQLRPGFTIVGYLKAELGVGEWGRLAKRAIETAGVAHATVVNTATASRQDHPFEGVSTDLYNFDTNLLCVNADQVPLARADLGTDCFRGRYTIGQWAWELEEFPDRWAPSFALVDEVWAISEFTRAALARATSKPVYSIPPAIVDPQVPIGVERSTFGLPPERFVFLFAFDLLSIMERKNPLGLIEAFCRAFPAPLENGPVLAIKVINGNQRLADLERVRLAAIDRPDILVVDRYLRSEEQIALTAMCDAYVSLHRSEGFGLTMAEAMALGKPVIATAYSGNMDFMDSDTALLVRWTYGEVPGGSEPYRAGARWADPNLDHAAELMRQVFENPSESRMGGARARRSVLEKHGLSSRAKLVVQRFDAIQRRRAQMMSTSGADGGNGAQTLRRIAAAPPSLDGPARRVPTLTRFYRRAVMRAQRHHDEHQRHVNLQLAEGVEGLRQEVIGGIDALRHELGDQVTRSDEAYRRLTDLSVAQERVTGLEAALADATRKLACQEETLSHLAKGIEGLETGAIADLFLMGEGLQRQLSAAQSGMEELRVVPFMQDPGALLVEDELGRPAIGYRMTSDGKGGSAYADFEDLFRGSEDLIRARQRMYVPMLCKHDRIVDVGCGRGEMLDLLKSEGIEGFGIDPDASMVERCRDKGHAVELMDAKSYFTMQEPTTFGAVFCAQVIEHLAYDELVKFLADSYRVLSEGGLLIAETVNPHAMSAFKTFWTDPTHRVPIFPEVAVSLCRSAGFEEAVVIFPNGGGELETDRWEQGEYAVVATKRGG